MLVKSKEDITPVLVNLYAILSWNKYYNMNFLRPSDPVSQSFLLSEPKKYEFYIPMTDTFCQTRRGYLSQY